MEIHLLDCAVRAIFSRISRSFGTLTLLPPISELVVNESPLLDSQMDQPPASNRDGKVGRIFALRSPSRSQ